MTSLIYFSNAALPASFPQCLTTVETAQQDVWTVGESCEYDNVYGLQILILKPFTAENKYKLFQAFHFHISNVIILIAKVNTVCFE